MQPFSSTGDVRHCFCTTDTAGNIVCCKCGTMLMSCDACLVRYCQYRNIVRKATGEDGMFMPDCLIASPNYKLLYKRAQV